MVTILGKTIGGQWLEFNNILSLNYDADRFIPCDSFDFAAIIQHEYEEFCEIVANLDDKPFFTGIVDKMEHIFSDKGQIIKMECRNKTALLLDNEVKPNMYFQLTSTQLFEQYARPFGIVGTDFPYVAMHRYLQIKKGASFWSTIQKFCHEIYFATPYINHNHILTLSPYNNINHTLSNTAGLKFSSLRIINDYSKLISRLHMKTATEDYGYYYGVVIDSPIALSKNIKRERCYHPHDIRPNPGKDETQRLLNKTIREYYSVIVTLPSFEQIHVGDCIDIIDKNFHNSNMFVSGVNVVINQTQGIITTLTLKDKRHLANTAY